MLIFKTKEKGRCVFASQEYKKGDIVEVCEYIFIPKNQIDILKKTTINDYWFGLDGNALILLGNGSLYNHSTKYPNMQAIVNDDKNVIAFEAIKNISIGDELVFDYGYAPKFVCEGNYAIRTVKTTKFDKKITSKQMVMIKV